MAHGVEARGHLLAGRDGDAGHDGRGRLAGRRLRGDGVVVGAGRDRPAGRRRHVVEARRIDRARVAGPGVGQAGVLAGDDLRGVERQAVLTAPRRVVADLLGDEGRRRAVHVRVVVGVVDVAEGAARGRVGEGVRQRIGRRRVVGLVELAAAAVEGEVDAHAARLGPRHGLGHVGRRHAAGRRRVVVGGVGRGIPGVVAQEQVVDLELEVVALVAEEDASRDPVELAVTQQLGLALVLVAGDGHHHLLAPVVGMGVDPEVGGAVGPGEEGLPVLPVDRRRGVAERLGDRRVVVGDRDRSLEVGEGGLAQRRERAEVAVLGGAGGDVEPVGRGGRGVVAELADPERALELGEARPLGVAQGGEVARGAVGVGHVVAEIAGGEDDRVVVSMVGAVVGEAVVGQRRDPVLTVVGDERAVRNALALELCLPGAEAGLGPVRRDEEDLDVDALRRQDACRRSRQHHGHDHGQRRHCHQRRDASQHRARSSRPSGPTPDRSQSASATHIAPQRLVV